jgi:hypothetical protein
MQAAFLFLKGKKESSCDDKNGNGPTEVHAGERTCQATANQPNDQGTDAPGNEFAFEAAINKGFLKPL